MIDVTEQWKYLARQDYSFYLEYVHQGDFLLADHHKLICERLEAIERGDLEKLMVFLPPRHSKSTTISENFPSWFLGRNPNKKVIIASYGDALAKKFGRNNRQRVETYGQELFDVGIDQRNSSVQIWGLEGHEGYCLSMGLGSSVTGFGCNTLIIDDPIKNRQQAESETIRDFVWDEYQSTLLTRIERKGVHGQILIQTRWHEDDLAGRLLNTEGEKWEVLELPALCEDPEKDPLNREEGQPLWAEHGYDEKWAEETKKAVGERTWASLYQQRPTSLEGGLFKRKWFKYFRKAPSNFNEVIMSVDTTFKDTKGTDFCVIQTWGRKGADKYLLDQIRDRMDLPTTMNAIRQMKAKFPNTSSILIEDKANGSAVIQMLKHEISGLIPINPTESKVARAYSVTPDFESGNVFLPADAPWLSDYVAELTGFPNVKNDDQTDATVQAVARMNSATEILIGRA